MSIAFGTFSGGAGGAPLTVQEPDSVPQVTGVTIFEIPEGTLLPLGVGRVGLNLQPIIGRLDVIDLTLLSLQNQIDTKADQVALDALAAEVTALQTDLAAVEATLPTLVTQTEFAMATSRISTLESQVAALQTAVDALVLSVQGKQDQLPFNGDPASFLNGEGDFVVPQALLPPPTQQGDVLSLDASLTPQWLPPGTGGAQVLPGSVLGSIPFWDGTLYRTEVTGRNPRAVGEDFNSLLVGDGFAPFDSFPYGSLIAGSHTFGINPTQTENIVCVGVGNESDQVQDSAVVGQFNTLTQVEASIVYGTGHTVTGFYNLVGGTNNDCTTQRALGIGLLNKINTPDAIYAGQLGADLPLSANIGTRNYLNIGAGLGGGSNRRNALTVYGDGGLELGEMTDASGNVVNAYFETIQRQYNFYRRRDKIYFTNGKSIPIVKWASTNVPVTVGPAANTPINILNVQSESTQIVTADELRVGTELEYDVHVSVLRNVANLTINSLTIVTGPGAPVLGLGAFTVTTGASLAEAIFLHIRSYIKILTNSGGGNYIYRVQIGYAIVGGALNNNTQPGRMAGFTVAAPTAILTPEIRISANFAAADNLSTERARCTLIY